MKIKSLLLLLFLTFTAQLNLIPDNTNPLLVLSPSTATTTTFEIKFTFPSTTIQELDPDAIGSNGLNYNQYFGLQFPTSMANDLNFDATLPLFSCALSNGSYSFAMVASPSQSGTISGITAEKNIAFCKLADVSTNIPLKVGGDYIYTLKITFGFNITTQFIKSLSLFTATASNPDRIIIDSLPLLGSVALYNDWTVSTPIPLNINSGKATGTNQPDPKTIYPYSTFDVSLVLQTSEFITANDYLIVIKFNTATVSAPTTVDSSQAASNDLNQIALKGQLKLSQLGSNGELLLGGVSEDLTPNRTFVLNLRGWTALSTDIGTLRSIEVLVYYKNTYSVFSYSTLPLIIVKKTPLTLTANHPEFWDIYRNAAWPVQFQISSNTAIGNSKGVYVVIRQKDAALSTNTGGNLVTFVASTCDFSSNSSVSANYRARPACYPLRLDSNYPNIASTFNGSGIFFFVNGPIAASSHYVLNVWIYADICGGANFNNIDGAAFAVPTFEVSIHNNIIPNKLNESRFDFTKEIAIGSGIFAGKCWNNKIQSFTVQTGEQNNNVGDNNFRSDLADNLAGPVYSMTLRFKEITSWHIGSNTNGACTSCYEDDIATSDSTLVLVEQFLYSTSKQLTTSSFFTAVAPLNLEASSMLSTGLPGSVISGNNFPGTLTVQFSKMWFTGTNNFKYSSTDHCFLSWALQDPASTSPVNYTSLAKDITASTDKNFIAAKRLSTSVSDFDENASILLSSNALNSASNIMKLVSTLNSGLGSENWLYFSDEIPANPNTNVAWYTNCITWNTSQTITSLFTYIDIQFIWTYTTNTSSAIFSNVRLIKLFPEGGVFNDNVQKVSGGSNVNPYVNHVVLAQNSDIFSPVCLIELNGASILGVAPNDSTSNVFAVWLGFGVLLESDYSDASATYPAGPILSTANVYGLQSQVPMHPENLYVSTDYNNGITPENVPLYVILNQLQNPEVFGNTAAAPTKGENSSSYHFLMGSLVLFTGLTGKGVQSSAGPLFIPYYCPYAYPQINTEERKYLNFVPSIFAAWLNMPNYSRVNQISSYLNYGTTSGSNLINKMSILLSRNSSASNTIKTGPFKGDSETTVASIATTNPILGTLRWNTYTDTTNTSVLNVFNGVRDTSQTNTKVTCTGFSLFFNLSIYLSSTLSFSTITNGRNGYYNSSKVFYVMGKPFTHAAYWGGLSYSGDGSIGNMPVKSPVSNTPSLTITGITRPNISSFISSTGVLTVSNKVAFSCVPAHSSAYDALTNYFYQNGYSNFILDWAPSSSNWQVSIGYDSNNVSQGDIAGNAAFKITSPTSIPSSSLIQFQSSTFNQNTICGIVTQNSVASDCITSGVNTFSCPVLNTASIFNICCYNININSSIDISSLNANFVTELSNSSLQKYILEDVYDASSQIASSPFSYTIDNTSLTDIIGTQHSTISDIAYNHNNQAGGLGSIQMTLNLARQLIRNMEINILGDFSPLLIPGNSPRCFVSVSNSINFGKNWDDGDALINACNVSSDMQAITILTNNFIYKCGMSFTNTLYLTLSPVVVADWNNNAINQNFIVNLSLIGGAAVALNNNGLPLSLATPVTSQSTVPVQWNTLCSVTSVVPRIPGEIAEYEFTIDLLTSENDLANSKLNEVTIFWPYQYYGSVLDNVYCYSNNVLLNCYFSDEGIMNIIFPQHLTVGIKTKVYVTGVPNPEIQGDYSFPCTVNNYDLTTLTRTNVITGSGVLSNGITGVNINGNLRFLNIPSPVTDTNPRETSIHKFRVAFDEATGLTSMPIEFKNDIVLHIYFPNDYNFPWYSDVPTATVQVYYSDNNYNITPSALAVSKTSVSGNRITLKIDGTLIFFYSNFMYLDISLNNIPNPNDSTLTTTSPVKITTSPYLITMTNSDKSVLYRTSTNINTYSTNLIGSSVVDTVNWSRGNSFYYDNTRWTMNIYTDETQTNKVLLIPGRYTVASFDVRPSKTNNQSHTTGDLSLSDVTFKTSQKTYVVSTAIMEPIQFLVGCTCLTAPGKYIINFTNSNTVDFTPLSPVIVIVDNSKFGTIQFNTNNSVPASGSLLVPVWITDYNFDKININWAGYSTNDATATMTDIEISPALNIISENVQKNSVNSVFATTNVQLAYSQTFTASSPNSCYSFANNPISFAITTGTFPDVTPLGYLDNNFKYADSIIDNTLKKNSVKFIFTPPVAPIFMYCALACINSSLPADSVILDPKLKNSNLLQFSSYQFLDTNPTDLVFSNLVRGQQYQLRCILKSTQANSQLTTTNSITLKTFLSGSTIYKIIPEPVEVTNCAQFNFGTDPGHETRDAILNYCQNIFSHTGWFHNGCIICTTPDASTTVGGLQFPQNATCPLSAMTVISTATNPTESSSDSYVVCPVPTSTCSTNAGPAQTYTALFSQFKNSLIKNKLLSAAVNNPNVNLDSNFPVVSVLDNSNINISNLSVALGSRNRFGQFVMSAAYSTPALCYWQISSLSTAPTFTSISSCTDSSWCGIAAVGPVAFNIQVINEREFASETTYYVYFGCSNDVPFTTSTSNVASFGNFSFKSKPILEVTPLAATSLNISITTLLSLIVILLLI